MRPTGVVEIRGNTDELRCFDIYSIRKNVDPVHVTWSLASTPHGTDLMRLPFSLVENPIKVVAAQADTPDYLASFPARQLAEISQGATSLSSALSRHVGHTLERSGRNWPGCWVVMTQSWTR